MTSPQARPKRVVASSEQSIRRREQAVEGKFLGIRFPTLDRCVRSHSLSTDCTDLTRPSVWYRRDGNRASRDRPDLRSAVQALAGRSPLRALAAAAKETARDATERTLAARRHAGNSLVLGVG